MSINEILDEIKDESLSLVKEEFKNNLIEAKMSTTNIVKKNAENIEKWLGLLAKGELDREEFEQLIASQKRKMEQYLNTLQIKGRARLEKITVGLMKIVLDKIAPGFFS